MITGLKSKKNVLQLAANSHSVYAGSLDKVIMKINGDTNAGFAQTASVELPGSANCIAADDDFVYVLQHTEEIVELNANDLSISKTYKCEGYTPTAIAFSKATKELWIGDNKGKVHMLGQADFAVAGECQGHVVGDSIVSMAQSADGTRTSS